MQYDQIRKLDIVARADEMKRAIERYEIFVAGPFIDINKDKDAPENTTSEGTRLRFHVYQHYKSAGHNMYLGEDHEPRTIGEKHYGSAANATFLTETTCRKMLVVIDKQYQGNPRRPGQNLGTVHQPDRRTGRK